MKRVGIVKSRILINADDRVSNQRGTFGTSESMNSESTQIHLRTFRDFRVESSSLRTSKSPDGRTDVEQELRTKTTPTNHQRPQANGRSRSASISLTAAVEARPRVVHGFANVDEPARSPRSDCRLPEATRAHRPRSAGQTSWQSRRLESC